MKMYPYIRRFAILMACFAVTAVTSLAQSVSPAPSVDDPRSSGNKVPTPRAVEAAQKEDADEIVHLSPFVVSDDLDDGYGPTETASASRFRQQLKDIPQTIVIFSEQFLSDIGATEMSDVMPLIGGNVSASTRSQDSFSVRGFGIGEVYLDGMRDTQEWGGGDFVHVQQVEVIKGPSSNLYGNPKGLGGVINRITKRPKDKRAEQVSMTVGDYGVFNFGADLTGPITESKKLLYRVNAVYRHAEYNRDFKKLDRWFLVPVVEWRITDKTKISFLGEFMRQEYQEDNFIPSVWNAEKGRRELTVPDNRRIDEPWVNSLLVKQKIRVIAEHQFNKHIAARAAVQQIYINNPIEQVEFLSLAANNRTVNRRAFWLNRWSDDTFAEVNVFGRYNTGRIEHSFIVAADYYWQHYRSNVRRVALSSIDLINPVYNTPKPIFPASAASTNTLGDTENWGFSATYQLNALEGRVILIAGIRYSELDASYKNEIGPGPYPLTTDPTNSASSPRWGGIVRPLKNLALYYQYSEVFQPQTAMKLDGSPLDPVTGSSEEYGIRFSLFDEKLNFEAVKFEVMADGMGVRLAPPNNSFFENSGRQTSNGYEYTITYNDKRLMVKAGWVTDEVESQEADRPGVLMSGHPKNRVQGIVHYRWPKVGRYGGLGVGATYSYVSERPLSMSDKAQKIAAYDVIGFNMSYAFAKGFNASLAVSNILDDRAVVANVGNLWRPLDPRMMKLTVSKRW